MAVNKVFETFLARKHLNTCRSSTEKTEIALGASTPQTRADGAQTAATVGNPSVLHCTLWYWNTALLPGKRRRATILWLEDNLYFHCGRLLA